jgi:adenine-specific DNA-methyltransferase
VGAAPQGRPPAPRRDPCAADGHRDTAAEDAPKQTVDAYGREVGPPKSGKARTITLGHGTKKLLADYLTAAAPGGAGPDTLCSSRRRARRSASSSSCGGTTRPRGAAFSEGVHAHSPGNANRIVASMEQVRHHPRRHAAVRTDEYLYSQLIPYIGNKRKLLPLVAEALDLTGVGKGTFVDLMTGTTVVSRLAKTLGFRVLANDWEPYSHQIALGTVALNDPPAFADLGGVQQVFEHLNGLAPIDGYVAQHLCPGDDDNPDPERERMFFTRNNGGRIDAVREQIAQWSTDGTLSERERAYIFASLVYAVSYVSNTSGVFKGFHHGWGGKTSTALYRILSELTLQPPVLLDNGQENVATRTDAQTLAGELQDRLGERPDVVYLDPPYNQHPYGSNYHVLNTVVLWDKPPLNPSILVDGKQHDKSAIRKDWRTERRSPYNHEKRAHDALKDLVGAIDARYLLMSYSTDGNIPLDGLLVTLAERGRLDVVANPYKRYRVSAPRMSPKSHNVEFVAVVDLDSPPSRGLAEPIAAAILAEEETALSERARASDQLAFV